VSPGDEPRLPGEVPYLDVKDHVTSYFCLILTVEHLR